MRPALWELIQAGPSGTLAVAEAPDVIPADFLSCQR